MRISTLLFPSPAILFPASGIALGILFLEGISLWPIVYLASLTGSLLAGAPIAYVLFMPVAHALITVSGAFLLRKGKVDPLFRRSRDMFWLLGTILVVSTIVPTVGNLGSLFNAFLQGTVAESITWGQWYTATVFSLIIGTPFVMRWFAKPRFARTWLEVVETVSVFSVLVLINYFLFFTESNNINGFSLVYLLLLPLFWLALRLRPRFVTLAFVITSVMAVMSLFVGIHVPPPELFSTKLFQTQLFMIIIAIIFYVLVSLEEDRRVTGNLMRSQVATLENVLARISSESRAKNDFIAVLAHELRNPLAPIASGIDFLKMKRGREKEELEMLSFMEDRMGTIRRLLDDLLDVSRISERKISLEKEVVDLNALVHQAVASTTHHFKDRHQNLSLQLPPEPVYLEADPIRIEQVLTNLLTNASKYSDTGGHIDLSVTPLNASVDIIVSDHGLGIEPELLDKIFEPFHQIESGERTKKGIGIGLSLVQSFVEMHEGKVRATSDGPGKGSQFTVTLPLQRRKTLSFVKKPLSSPLVPSAPSLKRKEVLVVDDNDSAAWSIGKLLELRGCTIDYAYDGNQAIERSQQRTYDVILLDIGLPDQDGYEVAKKLRANGYKNKLIALTGYSLEENRAEGQESSFDNYLVKPVGFADLKKAIPGL